MHSADKPLGDSALFNSNLQQQEKRIHRSREEPVRQTSHTTLSMTYEEEQHIFLITLPEDSRTRPDEHVQ